MKTIFKISVLAVVILFSGCASSDLTVLKRKYNKGYYVDFNNRKESKSTISKSEQSVKQASDLVEIKEHNTFENLSLVEKNSSSELPVTASANKAVSLTSLNKTKKSEALKTFNGEGFKQLSKQFVENTKSNTAIVYDVKKSTSRKANDQTILLVILCLFPFINLIAIYLKDGKQITTNFLVDLILDCLFFLPGVIFALLVILDVLNLA